MLLFFCWNNVKSFWSAKAALIFLTKNICVFGYKVVKHLTSWPLNQLVKPTMLWTTGPRAFSLVPQVRQKSSLKDLMFNSKRPYPSGHQGRTVSLGNKPLRKWGLLLYKNICSCGSKCFPLRIYPTAKRSIHRKLKSCFPSMCPHSP